jgi:cyclopropane-fatty-acyl-phospholipid synthase
MKTTTASLDAARGRSIGSRPLPILTQVARAVLRRTLSRLEHGLLVLREGEEEQRFGRPDPLEPLSATILVHDPRFYPTVVFGGNVGAGRAYIEGYWSADDLTSVIRVLARNQDVLARVDGGLSAVSRPLYKLLHAAHANSRPGSRRNIAAHYDLGEEFFRLFLDPTMSYSCAYFPDPTTTLEEAAAAKLERVCRKLDLSPSDHLLEIGTGWGGLALHAASRFGCRVTTATISRRQAAFVRERVRAAGLDGQVTVVETDYRDLDGRFDKLVSIEMIEAVGAENFDRYFAACSRLLQPSGSMLLQAIVMADRFYEHARKSVEFIKHYIFPGSCLPSLAAIGASLARATDLRVADVEDLTPHYPPTLKAWRERFLAAKPALSRLDVDDRRMRLWEYYFSYCEAGFREQVIGDAQMVLAKPRWRGRVGV